MSYINTDDYSVFLLKYDSNSIGYWYFGWKGLEDVKLWLRRKFRRILARRAPVSCSSAQSRGNGARLASACRSSDGSFGSRPISHFNIFSVLKIFYNSIFTVYMEYRRLVNIIQHWCSLERALNLDSEHWDIVLIIFIID